MNYLVSELVIVINDPFLIFITDHRSGKMRTVEEKRNIYLIIRTNIVDTNMNKNMMFQVIVFDNEVAEYAFNTLFIESRLVQQDAEGFI